MLRYGFEEAYEMYFEAWRDEQESAMEKFLEDRLDFLAKDYWNAFHISSEWIDGERDYYITVEDAEGISYWFKVYGPVPEAETALVIMELYDGDYDGRFGKVVSREVKWLGGKYTFNFIDGPAIA